MGYNKTIAWTDAQTKIAQLLQEGKQPYIVAKTLGVAKSSVTAVKNALAKGQVPGEKLPKATNPKPIPSPYASVQATGGNSSPEGPQPQTEGGDGSDGDGSEPPPGDNGETPVGDGSGQTSPQQFQQSVATIMKLVCQPVTCMLTPIMQNARIAATVQLGWDKNMPWEDFFDTCLYHLFTKSWGIVLQGYYMVDEQGNLAKAPSSGPGGNGGSPGQKKHVLEVTDDELKLAATIAHILVKMPSKGG